MPTPKPQKQEVLSLADLQKYLRIGRTKALELLESGEIPGRKLGTRWRIHKNAAEAWLLHAEG
jgi:excisionase family DNA binding protein